MSLDDPTKMYAEVSMGQQFYMKEMKETFGDMSFDGVHDTYEVQVRFVTEDVASQSSNRMVYDEFKVKFISSGETEIDYCFTEYATLSV